MSRHETQRQRLERFLRDGGRITPGEAWRRFGIYRLGARIHELRQAGLRIQTKRIPVETGDGGVAYVAQYELEE